MIRARLSELAQVLDARIQGDDLFVSGVGIDSRHIDRGSLFVAIAGPRFDGHDFAVPALKAGAAAVMLEHAVDGAAPALLVDDSRVALGRLGRWWRQQVNPWVVGITGSNGKTTVKQMLHAVLSRAGDASATQGNLNNDLGVPLTLCRLRHGQRYAVVEMGANHAGEIAHLAALAQPDVAVVTNAGPSHLEGFGSVEGVAHAKGELFQALTAGGTAVINADDIYASLWREFAQGRRIIDFGIATEAAVKGEAELADGHFRVRTPQGELALRLRVPGRHNRMNALAAIAAALAFEVPLEAIRVGLEGFLPAAGRLQSRAAACGARVIDDSYNANPLSLAAAIDVLVEDGGESWLVLGDMGELGPQAEELHRDAGRYARKQGVSRLFALGELSAAAVEAFGPGASHFSDHGALIDALRTDLRADVTVLVKGSRSMGMEHVAAALELPAGTEVRTC